MEINQDIILDNNDILEGKIEMPDLSSKEKFTRQRLEEEKITVDDEGIDYIINNCKDMRTLNSAISWLKAYIQVFHWDTMVNCNIKVNLEIVKEALKKLMEKNQDIILDNNDILEEEIEMPDLSSKEKFTRQRLEEEKITVDDESISYIINNCKDMRTLNSAISRLKAYIQIVHWDTMVNCNININLETVKEALKKFMAKI